MLYLQVCFSVTNSNNEISPITDLINEFPKTTVTKILDSLLNSYKEQIKTLEKNSKDN